MTKTTLYTGDDCPICDAAKDIIKSDNLDIEIVHIDPNTREWRDIMNQEGIMGIPVLKSVTVGKEVIDELHE